MNELNNNSIEIQRRIHLGRMLGEGAMGRVLDGFASDLGQHFAVKQLLSELMEDAETRIRFEEEAAIMASIDHPGVLPIYGLSIDDERRLFYVMKKIEGKTFAEHMKDPSESAASVPRRTRLLGILLAACETVASAHDKGIIHRDIKPANILIDREESVYVIDWGLAKRVGTSGAERTLSGKVMGTPGYMAPEQADGRSARAGAEADVFAFGALSSVAELRFIRTDSNIRPLASKRLMSVVEAAIDRGQPSLAEAMIATLLERAVEGTLANPLSEEDIQRLRQLAESAKSPLVLQDP